MSRLIRPFPNQWSSLVCLALLNVAVATAIATEKTPLELADPLIGTANSRWFFFTPGAVPFGMAKPGPCTDAHLGVKGGWEPVGYDGRHNSIESFVSFREFQIGGVAVMATTGSLKTVPGSLEKTEAGYRSRFDKQDEKAQPGYYSVRLKDYDVLAEVTATKRVAFHRFTFPKTDQAHLIFDVGNQQGESGEVLDAFVTRVGDREIEGFVSTLPAYVKHYQPGANVKMYFVIRLDKTPSAGGSFHGSKTIRGERTAQGPGAGLYLDFNVAERESIEVNMGMSYTSIANARLNLDTEAKDLSFDQAREQAQASWRDMFSRILVSGGKERDRVKFYTGLYHALLGRGINSDINGAYPRNDGGIGQIPLKPDGLPEYNHFNSDSVWGTFWNLNLLWALAYPEIYSEFVRCHLDIYRDCGWLPDSIATEKFVSGVGTDYAGVLVCGAYAWGIRDYDAQQAFAAVFKNETGWQNRLIGVGKADLKPFVEKGYIPLLGAEVTDFSGSTAEGSRYSASHTLEYSYSSGAAAQFAKALGKTNEYQLLLHQSRGWENLFDSSIGFIRPKDANGNFIASFDPKNPRGGFQEGNAYQYSFYVPHDPAGLIYKMGLNSFQKRLAEVFGQAEKTKFGGGELLDAFSGLDCLYNQGDEPDIQIPWLFNKITVCLNPQYYQGRSFEIEVTGDPAQDSYIQSASLNGEPLNQCWIDWNNLVSRGGKLGIVLGKSPNIKWGVEMPPPSLSDTK